MFRFQSRGTPVRAVASFVTALAVAVATFVSSAPAVAAAGGAAVVVSQVYGGGGNEGSTFRQDFIEVFNRGTEAVSLDGWSVQYASATGTRWQKTDLSGSLAPGQYLLVREAAGSGGTRDLPSADVTGTIALGAASGKVALVASRTLLACGGSSSPCLPNAAVRDFVGYGGATSYEGSRAAPAASNTSALVRRAAGCADTDDNAADLAAAPPDPRSRASAARPCQQSSELRLAGPAVPVPAGTNITLTATITPSSASGAVTFRDGDVDLGTAPLSGGTATFTTKSLAAGWHALTAVWPGGGGLAAATSAVVRVLVYSVAVSDDGFAPVSLTTGSGLPVVWAILGPEDQGIADESGMNLFGSGVRYAGDDYAFAFPGAGAYPYREAAPPERHGTISVPMTATPGTGALGTSFTIGWAHAAPPSPFVFDVQVRRPGESRYVAWRSGSAPNVSFTPSIAGTWSFRARLRRVVTGAASGWSPSKSITVSP